MAELMWTHGEEALAKSLVSCKLYKAMAHEAAEDDLDTEIYEELKTYAKEFEMRGLKLLDFCYRQDQDKAQRLLTCELNSWSSQSCLSLAVAANHRALLAHPCSQVILADLWMGALRTRKNTNLKVSVRGRLGSATDINQNLIYYDWMAAMLLAVDCVSRVAVQTNGGGLIEFGITHDLCLYFAGHFGISLSVLHQDAGL